ncbi:MAG: glycosyltransferase [Verrucomicrobia bacterium]|nr:glycosyltransferase [Verrucomicrobiota bacterium]
MPNSTIQTFPSFPIIVHSHLGWDWVWQRPQQFLSRFSLLGHPVLFVEGPTPVEDLEKAAVELREVTEFPNITVLRMQMPSLRWSDGAWVDKERRRLVQEVLAGPLGLRFREPVQWFYDPMAATPFAGHMKERAIVFDCMDQLSQFRGAPQELIRRERELLAAADVVFAGGPKIGREKIRYNANTHSYGCGVDVSHFSRARRKTTPLPADIAHLPGPVFGFFGVVDERMDYDLVAALADAQPQGSVVILGPTTKIDPATLPQRPNLHWLGGRDYQQLPDYVRGFDVCLMPFAINAATEFINPTKALEYMATGRPIVSTAIEDVVEQFSDVVTIAPSPEEFLAACDRAAQSPDAGAIERGLEVAERNSWEAIVAAMTGHIEQVLAAGVADSVSGVA